MPPKKRKLPESFEEQKCTGNPFLEECNVFILKAGIENKRMQIFQTQLQKYGGTQSLHEKLQESSTHLVVDDKIEVDRMCRLLNIDKPPEIIQIVRSTWLSACFKQKLKVDESSYIIDTSSYSVHNNTNSKISAESDVNVKSDNISDQTNKQGPKYGAMFSSHYKKPKLNKADGEDDDPGSDYVQSDGEDQQDPEAGPSTDVTPDTSPGKHLPVIYTPACNPRSYVYIVHLYTCM